MNVKPTGASLKWSNMVGGLIMQGSKNSGTTLLWKTWCCNIQSFMCNMPQFLGSI